MVKNKTQKALRDNPTLKKRKSEEKVEEKVVGRGGRFLREFTVTSKSTAHQ